MHRISSLGDASVPTQPYATPAPTRPGFRVDASVVGAMHWPLHYYSTFLSAGENTAHTPLIFPGSFKHNHCLWYVIQTLSMLASGTNRWGDYQSAWLGPSAGALVWIIGQIGLFLNPNFATPALGLKNRT